MNKKNKDILISILGIIALLLIITAYFWISSKFPTQKAKIITDKNDYEAGNTLKVKIKNGLKTDICFSSCYPYYFEKKDGAWESYQYINCPKEDRAEECVLSGKTKAFEINIPSIKGYHRLAVPACIGCNLYDKFRRDKWFYSNEFNIE